MWEYLHEQTGLTAGTIADDDELATDLGHLNTGQGDVSRDQRSAPGSDDNNVNRQKRKFEVLKAK